MVSLKLQSRSVPVSEAAAFACMLLSQVPERAQLAILLYLMDLGETQSSLPYSLWALYNHLDPPGCVVWVLWLWDRQKTR